MSAPSSSFRVPALPPVTGQGLLLPTVGARSLALAYLRYLNLTFAHFVQLEASLPEGLRAAHTEAVAIAVRAFGRNQRAALGCVAAPAVGTPLRCLKLHGALPELRDLIDRGVAEAVPHVLLELSTRGLMDPGEAVDLDLGPLELLSREEGVHLDSLALGVRIRPAAAATRLRFRAGALEALRGEELLGRLALDPSIAQELGSTEPNAGLSVERAYLPLGRLTHLALVDRNPTTSVKAHPERAGNPLDLGLHPTSDWTEMLDKSIALIDEFAPEIHGEMQMLLHEVIPVGYHPERHFSASYREAVGSIYMSLHPNVMTMAEALVHEFQHNKLNVACYSTEFISNGYYPLFKSPVRPDPRPLWGILLAVHAFIPIALMYRRMRAAGHPGWLGREFGRRMGEIDLKNHEGMEMLRAHAVFTPAGKALFAELEVYDRAHMAERAAAGLPTSPTEAHIG